MRLPQATKMSSWAPPWAAAVGGAAAARQRRRVRLEWPAVGLALCAIMLAALPAAAQGRQARGTWWSDDGRHRGFWSAEFDFAGGQIGGRVTLTGIPGLRAGEIAGTLTGNHIAFGVLYRHSEAATFEGTVHGLRAAGTFTTPVGVRGNWKGALLGRWAQRQPTTANAGSRHPEER